MHLVFWLWRMSNQSIKNTTTTVCSVHRHTGKHGLFIAFSNWDCYGWKCFVCQKNSQNTKPSSRLLSPLLRGVRMSKECSTDGWRGGGGGLSWWHPTAPCKADEVPATACFRRAHCQAEFTADLTPGVVWFSAAVLVGGRQFTRCSNNSPAWQLMAAKGLWGLVCLERKEASHIT